MIGVNILYVHKNDCYIELIEKLNNRILLMAVSRFA